MNVNIRTIQSQLISESGTKYIETVLSRVMYLEAAMNL